MIVPLFANRADKYAEQGDVEGVSRMHWFGGIFGMCLSNGNSCSSSIFCRKWSDGNGIECDSAICSGWAHNFSGNPTALGFAILLRMILNKKIAAFLAIGFVMTAYLGLPVLGVAIMAVSIVALMAFGGFGDAKPGGSPGVGEMEVEEDDDF